MGLAILDDAYDPLTLTTLIRTMDTSNDDHMFQDLFDSGKPKQQPAGDKAKWDELRSSRGLAPITGLLSPTPKAKNQQWIPRETPMFRISEQREIPWTKLLMERAPGQLAPDADLVIREQMKDMLIELKKTKELACVSSLMGAFSPAAAGIPGTDYPFTLQFPVKTKNRTSSWADPTTKIIGSELVQFQSQQIQNCGRSVKRLFVSDGTYGNVLLNEEVKGYAHTAALAQAFAEANTSGKKGVTGVKIGSIDWNVNGYGYVPDASLSTTLTAASNGAALPQATLNVVSTAGYPTSGVLAVTSSAGVQVVQYTGVTATTFTGCSGGAGNLSTGGAVVPTYAKWLPDGTGIFLPEDLSEVLCFAEGMQIVPVTADIVGASNPRVPEPEYGLISYAKWLDEPGRLVLYVSWFGSPLVLFPDAVLNGTLYP